MNIICNFILVVGIITGTCLGASEPFSRFPLRNGDFSTYQGWGRPADWNPSNESGKHTFKMDPIAAGFMNPPSAAVIETHQAGRGYYFQTVSLMKGDYRLGVEISGTVGAKAQVDFTGGSGLSSTGLIPVGEKWQKIQLELSVPGGEAGVYLFSNSPAASVVKFRNAKIKIKKLASSPLSFENADQLGGLVLPAAPTPAEQYAGYELQRYLFKMTGKAPGIKGRDETFDGALIYIGRAVPLKQRDSLKDLAADSYLIRSQDKEIFLTGKDPQGTPYAIYDFLNQQGCRWVIPGSGGEVVPRRKALARIKNKIESPDYYVRGFFVLGQDFFPGGGPERGWIYINADDYLDWALRNRLNAIWGGGETFDFGADRGHGWIQNTGHSFNSLIAPYEKYFKAHPDWYPLVRGKRMPVADIGPMLPNQLCVSNPSLREYTVNLALDYFKKNPTSNAFPMNPMDGPNYWCECDQCKALDPPGYQWNQDFSGPNYPSFPNLKMPPMTDRVLNYVNYVADRVAKVYPDKWIEMYAYNPRTPPLREKVHSNVMIKFAFQTGRAMNVGLMDPADSKAKIEREYLAGWRKAGTKRLAYYTYADWEHPDAALFWFYYLTDMIKNVEKHYNGRAWMGETETQIQADPMWYAVMARTLWNVAADYKSVVRDICDTFYGPAADDLYAYNMLMDHAVVTSDAGKGANYDQNAHREFSLETLEQGRILLEKAAAKVKKDTTLTRRIALARFSHAVLSYVRALSEKNKTAEWAALARREFDLANALRSEYNIMIKLPTAQHLKDFYYPVIVDQSATVVNLPIEWNFKTDPANVGLKEKWYKKALDSSWVKIKTTSDWTSQGHAYHGAAWYQTDFQIPDPVKKGTPLVLYFEAMDGYGDIYLDGVKIGEQKTDVGVMWDKPFTVRLPTTLQPATTYHLMVRVQKDNFGAGIWKPVKIVKAR